MATSLLALLDDIATVLDDVALMSKVAARKAAVAADDVGVMAKVAAQKTAGVLGDDLALNAQQVAGVKAERELPVVWAVAKGSFVNKLILVPAALLISAFAPALITPLLMIGGAFLCYEGFEKIAHRWLHRGEAASEDAKLSEALLDPNVDLVALETDKIKGAIRTDFILSAEIIVIALGTMTAASFAAQVMTLSLVAVLMTVGVYGLVAGIVKLDDLGLWLTQRPAAAAQAMGRGILALAPKLMKALSVLGTAAMFLVGGGILVHGLPWLHHLVQGWTQAQGGVAAALVSNLFNAAVGIVAGGLIVGVVTLFKRLKDGGKEGLPAH